jgi:2-dehydropantoate 2-reductase
MARIAIVGPGAVGGTMAAWLGRSAGQQSGHEVTLCARRPLAELTVETPGGVIVTHPTVLTDPAQARPVDWILVATKAYDATGAAAWLRGLGAAGAPAAILQNGVEHVERFSPYLPAERLLTVIVECPAERDASGHIRQRRRALLMVADSARGREFAELFAGTDVDITLVADIKTAAWQKLCLNSAGVINALVLEPAAVMHDEQIAETARQIVRECLAVGRAEGAALGDEVVEWVVQRYRSAAPDSVNSIHADRLAGRPTEIDARNGVIVRLGRKHGIPTPCNQMAVALLETMSRQQRA